MHVDKRSFITQFIESKDVSVEKFVQARFFLEVGFGKPFEGAKMFDFVQGVKAGFFDGGAGVEKFDDVVVIGTFVDSHLLAEAEVGKFLV